MTSEMTILPRQRASSDIKLLRLDLIPRGKTPCEDIGCEWSPAQPTETLSPEKAAQALGIEIWAPQSVVKKRFRTLQLRYPPEQFPDKHLDWRPSSELLANPRARLNWFWQSGLIPIMWSTTPHNEAVLWDETSVEPLIDAATALKRATAKVKNSPA